MLEKKMNSIFWEMEDDHDHFIGTGIHRESRWFRPLSEEIPFPIADWNGDALDNEDLSEGFQESEDEMDVSEEENTEEEREDELDDNIEEESETKDEMLSSFRKSVFKLVCKVEERYEEDTNTYKKAILSFVKKADKVSAGSDGMIHKVLFSFGKETFQAVKKGRKKKAGAISVEPTSRSRRKIKHRGAGPSQSGRPTADQTSKLQLEIIDDDEIVSYKIPSKKAKKSKHPHNLAASVEANRAAERKH